MSWLFPPRDSQSVAALRQEYARLPTLQACDKSPRIELLEKLVKALSAENDTLRSQGPSLRPNPQPYYAPRPAPKRLSVAVGIKGSLFSHPNTIQTEVKPKLLDNMEVQWATHDYPQGTEVTANLRVAFFRVSDRVSPTELKELRALKQRASCMALEPRARSPQAAVRPGPRPPRATSRRQKAARATRC